MENFEAKTKWEKIKTKGLSSQISKIDYLPTTVVLVASNNHVAFHPFIYINNFE